MKRKVYLEEIPLEDAQREFLQHFSNQLSPAEPYRCLPVPDELQPSQCLLVYRHLITMHQPWTVWL